MKVFLSWSGELSHGVAKALEKWLPYMIQSVQPFLSSDISKGDRWGEVLGEELNTVQYAIICVTRYNLFKPWMYFESGALVKFVGHSNVAPLLFRLDHSSVAGLPLAQFQSVLSTQEEMLSLVHSINNALGEQRLNRELLTCTFEHWWDYLEADLRALAPGKSEETQTPFSWLYCFEDLQLRESQAEVKSVWIVTTDIAKHLDVVRHKMPTWSDKVECRFFVREAEQSDIVDLESVRNLSTGKFDYRNFKRDNFDTEAATDYVIFNADPERRNDMPARLMFLRLPVRNEEYWVTVEEKAAETFTDRFNKLWKEGRIVESAAGAISSR